MEVGGMENWGSLKEFIDLTREESYRSMAREK